MTPRWWSQPFAPEGSAAAEGIVKQLGKPTLDPLTVLVREAAQNSWDARLGLHPVAFHIEVKTLGYLAKKWKTQLLPGPPAESGVDIAAALAPDAYLLVVSDRQTVGLGGPLRAGHRAAIGERADFVQFLRNVGEPRDQALGGGTYGFGKGIYYRLSSAATILVDTQTTIRGRASRRLIGATLGPSWYEGDRRFTGRHWWGDIAEDNIPDPVLGRRAEQVASSLGLPGFEDGTTGTDIAVIDAHLGTTSGSDESEPRTAQEAGTFLASSLLWNLWPKFFPDENGQYMNFSVGVDGVQVHLPSPANVAELKPYVEALAAIRGGGGLQYTRTRPPRTAGRFALSLASATRGTARQVTTMAKPYDGSSHHVARMRSAELVVDYLEGPTHPDPLLRYGAVFRASAEADELFSSAEPPTHDDWVESGLQGTARGVISGARRFVLDRLEAGLGLGIQTGSGRGRGLGEFSARLASMVPTIPGGGAASLPGGPTAAGTSSKSKNSSAANGSGDAASTHGGRRGRPRIVGAPSLDVSGGAARLRALVLIPASDTSRSIRARALVVVEGGARESEAPAGASSPAITGWDAAEGSDSQAGDTLTIPSGEACEWWVYATHLPDVVVRFQVESEA